MLTSRSNGALARHVAAVEHDAAGGRLLEARDHPQRRRLARAGRTEHREELAVADLEVDARDGDDVAVALLEALEADRRRGRARRIPGVGVATAGRCSCAWSSTWACGPGLTEPAGGSVVLWPAGCVVTRGCRLQCMAPSATRGGAHARCRCAAVSSDLRPAVPRARLAHHGAMHARFGPPSLHAPSRMGALRLAAGATAILVLVAACDTGAPAGTPPITPGTSAAPREVNIVARDYTLRPVGHLPGAGRDRGPARAQRRPRAARGDHRDARRPARLGGGRGSRDRRAAGTDPERARPEWVRRRPRRRRLGAARGRHLDGAGGRRRPRRAAGSSAATSPATGRRGWSCRSSWSARTGSRWGRRRPCRRSARRAADRGSGRATDPAPARARTGAARRSRGGTFLRRASGRAGPRPRTFGRAFGP